VSISIDIDGLSWGIEHHEGMPHIMPRTRSLILALGSVGLCSGLVSAALPYDDDAAAQSRPNVLLVVADDHGRWACGPYGNRDIATPTLDFLAATGIRMENAYTTSPVCSPSRASLLTGRIPSQHGIHDFLSEDPEYDAGWLEGEVLLSELLRSAGYRTGLIGKWHCTTNSVPPARGFDRWLSYDTRPEGWRNQYRHRGAVHFSDQGEALHSDGFQTRYLTARAQEFIGSGGPEKPWFLLFAPTDTHAPFEGHPVRWVARYRNAKLDTVPRNESSPLPHANASSVPPKDPRELLAQYAASVSSQDSAVGELLDYLDEIGELDNTLVVYTSDHGIMLGHHGLLGKANATVPQNMYEEAIRIPMLLRWPNGIADGGRSLDIVADHCDLFWTVLDAARVRVSDSLRRRINSPGRSLLEAAHDSDVAWRRFQFVEHGNARLVTDGRYKLIRRYPPLDPRFGDEFYDLVQDPRETTNLFAAPGHRVRIEEMGRALDAHFARYLVPRRSGLKILEQPRCNGSEPWRKLAAQR
jgi:arylsulfatase A-like enzyme